MELNCTFPKNEQKLALSNMPKRGNNAAHPHSECQTQNRTRTYICWWFFCSYIPTRNCGDNVKSKTTPESRICNPVFARFPQHDTVSERGYGKRYATNLMLNWQGGHGVTELNYPHIIDIWGYQRHHDVATRSGKKRGGARSRRTQQVFV